MNEELLAFIGQKANPSLQCTSRPPSYFNNTGATTMGIITSILALKRLTDYYRTKAYRQSVSLYCSTNILSQLVFVFTASNMFFSITYQSSP
jgi:hypothetical protein